MEKAPNFSANKENSNQNQTNEKSKKLAFGGNKLKLIALGALATLASLAAKAQEKSASFASTNRITAHKNIETHEEVTDQIRRDWNGYIDWLRGKHLAGDSSLDHNNLGKKMINEYRKEHPGTTVSNDIVGSIQEEFFNYRTWLIGRFERGEIEIEGKMFDPNNTAANDAVEAAFMPHLSPKADSYSGRYTTAHKFAIAYLESREKHYLADPSGKLAIIGEVPIQGDHVKTKEVVEFSKIEDTSASNKNK